MPRQTATRVHHLGSRPTVAPPASVEVVVAFCSVMSTSLNHSAALSPAGRHLLNAQLPNNYPVNGTRDSRFVN